MQQGELISAIATAPGESGIGIIRISGKGAVDLAKRCFVNMLPDRLFMAR